MAAAASALHLPAEASGSASSSSSPVSALISKRAKAVHKKLQRINAYSEGTLNADQQRAIATKPTLEAIEAELSALLSQSTAHEAAQKSEAQAEIDRLTALVNSNAQRADQLQSQLHFLLQFLHLYALVQSPTSDAQQSPQLPPGLAAILTSTDIHALTSVFFAFANAPLVQSPASSAEGAIEIIDRIRNADPSEIVITDSSASDAPAGVTHSRIAELVQALTAAPPLSTRLDAADDLPASSEAAAQPTSQSGQISFGAPATLLEDEQGSSDAHIAMPVPHPAQVDTSATEPAPSSSTPAPVSPTQPIPQQSQTPSYLNFDADSGFSVGSGPIPSSAGGRILFMQASEVEGEVEPEPPVSGAQSTLPDLTQHQQALLRFDAGADEDDVEPQAAPPAEPAHTIEPEGGAVDGAPEAEPVPAAQPDALIKDPIPPVLRDLVDSAPAAADPDPITPAQDTSASVEAPPVVDTSASAPRASAAKKIDWASLDEDDDVDEISEEVMRSVVLSGNPAAASATNSTAKPAAPAPSTAQQQASAPPAAEAEARRLAKQIEPTAQPRANGSGTANGTNTKSGRSGSGGGKQPPSGPASAPVLRKPEPIVDEDGFVMQVTKKTLRQQQLAAQQQPQQQNRGSGGGRSGGRGGGGGGARSGRGVAGQGQGQRRERREGNAPSSDAAAAATGAPANGPGGGQQKERTSSSGQQQANNGWRTNSGSGAGRGLGAAGSGGANPNQSGGRGRGNRNRASNASGAGPRPSNAAPAEGAAPSA